MPRDQKLVQQRELMAMQLAARLGEATRTLFPGDHEVVVSYRPSPAETRGRTRITDRARRATGRADFSRAIRAGL